MTYKVKALPKQTELLLDLEILDYVLNKNIIYYKDYGDWAKSLWKLVNKNYQSKKISCYIDDYIEENGLRPWGVYLFIRNDWGLIKKSMLGLNSNFDDSLKILLESWGLQGAHLNIEDKQILYLPATEHLGLIVFLYE